MPLSSSTSDGVFAPLFGSPAVDAELTGSSWLQAMLDFERALALVQARHGLIPAEAGARIAAVCTADRYDVASIARRSVETGTPVVPLVADVRAALPLDSAPFVHAGATSQDTLDTAAALVARRALEPLLADAAAVAEAIAGLAHTHRATVMTARTLLQQAVPTTFGVKAAGWLVAVDEARGTLTRVARDRLAVQLGGAAGTSAAYGTSGVALTASLAAELGLAEPVLPWHTNRSRVAELAGALGTLCGVFGKIARDVILLAQNEVGEVTVSADQPGGSSAMPHKDNPVGAVLVAATTARAPALVATVLTAMVQEHERAAGAWHAEWETVGDLLHLTGGAALHLRTTISRLEVHRDRMSANLAASRGMVMAEALALRLAPSLGPAAAQDVVRAACTRAAASGTSLHDEALADDRVTAVLDRQALAAALDPAGHLGSASELVDRALAAHLGTADATQ